jgi:type I restriction enzyme S subunit
LLIVLQKENESLIKGIIDFTFRNSERRAFTIKELGEPFRGMSLAKEDLSEDGHECILYGELFTIYGAMINEVKSKTRKVCSKFTFSTHRDLLFPSSTTVDARSLISPSAIIKDGVILGGDMFAIRVNERFNNIYLSYLFNFVYKNLLAKYAKGSTIIHLHYNEIKDIKIELPVIDAQDRIVEILTLLENKLVVETALESLYQTQKGYLLKGLFI